MNKYPKEIFNSIKSYSDGTFKTFSTEAELSRAAISQPADKLRSPLMPEPYSRFKVSIFGNDGGVNANIRESEIDGIYEMSIACINEVMSPKEKAPAQVPFKMGTFAGKTPAQIILEKGSCDEVLKQKDFLSKNIAKFPANKAIIQSIDQAVKDFNAGTLSDTGSGGTEIFNTGVTRHIGKPDERGFKKVYGIKIVYFDKKFTITIINLKAPVATNEKGQTIVKLKEAEDKKTMSFDLSVNEYLSLICKARRMVELYEQYTFKACWEAADKIQQAERGSSWTDR